MISHKKYTGHFMAFLYGMLLSFGCGGSDIDKPVLKSKYSSEIKFKDVTEEAGLGEFKHENGAFGSKWFPESMGAGGGFIDFNNDGFEDILLVGGNHWSDKEDNIVSALALYKNDGDGKFSNVTTDVGLGGINAYGFGISVADYDNDDDQDFFFTTLDENMFFRNNSGYFTEVGKEIGILSEHKISTSAIFFDADKDGFLDLYVGNYIDWSPESDIWCTFQGKKGYCTPDVYNGVPSRFYQNNGDGTFSDKTSETGFLPAPGKTLGVAELDHNKDGWPDLVVANDLERDLLYENNRDGTFTEKGVSTGMAYDPMGKVRAGMGVDAGIVDQTGEVTIFVGNFQNEMFSVYRYSVDGFFNDYAEISKLGRESLKVLTFGLFLIDVELDGDLDLFAVNGHIQVENDSVNNGFQFRQLPQLFLNNDNGIFNLFHGSENSVFNKPIVGRGAAFADYDKDGDLDVLITENAGPVHLWRNDLYNESSRSKNNFLRVELRGSISNRDGIGSLIELFAGDKTFSHRIRTGSSYLSQSEKVATFGLSDATIIDSLNIHWPSGIIDTFSRLTPNKQLIITEGETLQ
ncbi:MAG TPA: CRTAC1 family protein [Candidatus Marinimicrobia bacterium]|nr:CRTAC1 family protein [Candidatus Neomarinimicrobiota bacterium]